MRIAAVVVSGLALILSWSAVAAAGPVEHRDFVHWTVDLAQLVGALGSVAAIWFAAYSLRVAKFQSAAARDRLVLERRLDFELGLLKELAEVNHLPGNVAQASQRFTVLAAILGSGTVPLACAAVRLPSTPEAEAQVNELSRNGILREYLRSEIEKEILAAIETRVSYRSV